MKIRSQLYRNNLFMVNSYEWNNIGTSNEVNFFLLNRKLHKKGGNDDYLTDR